MISPNHMQKIDGKKIQKDILEKVKHDLSLLSFKPVFSDVLVGEDPASAQYVRMKGRMAEEIGIAFQPANFPATITTEELVAEIQKLNNTPNICGVIIQLPLPEGLNAQEIFDAVDPRIDVDCLGSIASAKFYENKSELGFPTALACVHILDSLNLDLSDKKIVVLGQGMLVGKPVAHILKTRGLEVTSITRNTENKEDIIKNADIIISGTGQGKFIKGAMVTEGVVLIDAGTVESNGGIVGDVDLESVEGVASFVSPVPGGVGPVTVAMLMKNVLLVAQNKNKSNE